MIHIQQKKETTMIERQQQEALHTDEAPVLAQDIIWEGRPSFLPFLLGSENMMALTAVWFLLFWYFDFTWFLPTKIWGIFWGFSLIQGLVYWHWTHYYVTRDYLIVKIGRKYHRMAYNNIANYHIIPHLSAWIFGCRTIQFGYLLDYSSTRGDKVNVWRYETRFWCIKDWRKVDQLIRARMMK